MIGGLIGTRIICTRGGMRGRARRMSVLPAGALAGALVLTSGSAALGQDMGAEPAGGGFLPLELSVRLQTDLDHRVRGLSRSDNELSVGATARVMAANGLYAQLGLRSVDIGNDADLEGTAGIGAVLGGDGTTYDLSAVYTFYPDAPAGSGLNHVEFILAPRFDLGPVILTGQAAYSPDYFGAADQSLYLQTGLIVPVYQGDNGLSVSLAGDVGYSFLQGADDYADWSIGGTVGLEPFDLTVEYVGTDLDGCGATCETDLLVTLGADLALN
jgi:uncharacterized protein (TIGR02001 family)